jgi:hypothetical protein
MYEVRAFLTPIGLLALIASCATQAPPPSPAPAAIPSPPPVGSLRLPGVVTCETEVGCVACSDDHDKELVQMAPLVHSAKIHECFDRGAQTRAGAESRVVFRVGIDPTGAVGTSCVVRTSLNDPTVESCLADLALTWKFPPPKSGGWALVDAPIVVAR